MNYTGSMVMKDLQTPSWFKETLSVQSKIRKDKFGVV